MKRIQHLLEIESCIWNILEHLVKKQSSRGHSSGRERSVSDLVCYSQIQTPTVREYSSVDADDKDSEIEQLKTKITHLEQENAKLKRLLRNLQ